MIKLKVGDTVRVYRKVAKSKGWCNTWVKSMDCCVGKVFVVGAISDTRGVLLEYSGQLVNYNFPLTCLARVK